MVDAYAWIEFFLGSEKGAKVKQLVETAEQAYTPDSVLAELARKYLREKVSEEAVRNRLAIVQTLSRTVTVTAELAVLASKGYFELSEIAKKKKHRPPSLFDGLVLGAARLKEAKIVTGDPHFQDLRDTIMI